MSQTLVEILGVTEDVDGACGPERLLVGIDVGGTTVKVALVTLDGVVQARDAVRTKSMRTGEEVLEAAKQVQALVAENLKPQQQVVAVGLALPGVVTAEDILLMAPNVDVDLEGLILALERVMGVKVYPVNDANAAALGEMWKGAGEGARNLVFVTLGTGVGGGMVFDGAVAVGRNGGAGEIGHIVVEPGGRQCNCGQRGCLEMYTSSRGLVYLYRAACEAAGEDPVPLEHDAHALPIVDAARTGDPVAQGAISQYSAYLGRALGMLACALDPEAFVIGGGMSAAFDLFGPELVAAYQAATLPTCADTPIVEATMGNLAGMVGAAYHAKTREGL